VEASFTSGGTPFRILDVGGQRPERRHWFHSFDDVAAVLFVTSLSEYDQQLAEEPSCNRMQESLTLFAEICNSKFFYRTTMILLLVSATNTSLPLHARISLVTHRPPRFCFFVFHQNKSDLFRSKLIDQGIPLTRAFPDYTGGSNEAAAIDFIRQQFHEKNEFAGKKVIHTHVISATDTNSVRQTFMTLKGVIIKNSLLRIALG
jgi:guanine nucleotide-binding protein G(i) subunit alpha